MEFFSEMGNHGNYIGAGAVYSLDHAISSHYKIFIPTQTENGWS